MCIRDSKMVWLDVLISVSTCMIRFYDNISVVSLNIAGGLVSIVSDPYYKVRIMGV